MEICVVISTPLTFVDFYMLLFLSILLLLFCKDFICCNVLYTGQYSILLFVWLPQALVILLGIL